MSSESGFIKCPHCGEFDERRLHCKCGYRMETRGSSQTVPALKKPFLLRLFSSGVRWFIAIVGLGVAYLGYEEYRVGASARKDATDVDLADLETGANPPQNHVRLGEHLRLYADIIYIEEERSGSDRIKATMYPIVSLKHPLALQGQGQQQAENGQKRSPHDFRVLVLTKEYKSVKQMPKQDRREAHIQGMIINSIRSLADKERDFIRESFPDLDESKLLILEKDRKPVDPRTAILLMACGILVILAMVGLTIWNHRVDKRHSAPVVAT
jgi:hypothetical protein